MNHLNDWLAEHRMTQAELAAKLDVTRETVNRAANADTPSGSFLWKFGTKFGFAEAAALITTKEQ